MTKQSSLRAGSMGLIGLAVVAAALVAVKRLTGVDLPPWARFAILLAVFVIAIGSTWRWWSVLDEVAREAHKFAWYWGGSVGMAVAGIVMVLVDGRHIATPDFLPGQHGDFTTGALTVMLAQIVGYLVAWAGWWWTRR
jgi:hypothetical protein